LKAEAGWFCMGVLSFLSLFDWPSPELPGDGERFAFEA
jgi:hypothetical protein